MTTIEDKLRASFKGKVGKVTAAGQPDFELDYKIGNVSFGSDDLTEVFSLLKFKRVITPSSLVLKNVPSHYDIIYRIFNEKKLKDSEGFPYRIVPVRGKSREYAIRLSPNIRKLKGPEKDKAVAKLITTLDGWLKSTIKDVNRIIKSGDISESMSEAILKTAKTLIKRGIDPVKAMKYVLDEN